MVQIAEIFPNEGLDVLLAQNGFATGGAAPANTFLAVFTAYTASTVGTSVSVRASYTEPTTGGYARQTISSASWGAIGNTTSGRITTCAQISFPQTTAGGFGTINGYFIASALTTGTCITAANFDDTTAVTVNSSDQIKVTPSVIYGG